MLKNELLELIKKIPEDGEILDSLKGIEGLANSSIDYSKLTIEDYKNILENNKEIKGYWTSEKDSVISKAIDSHDKKFMAEKLPKLVEDELKKKSNEGLTEEQIQLKELQKQIETMKFEKQRAELSSKYSKTLAEKKLPSDLIDFVLSDNEEVINSNISKFETMMKSYVDGQVNERLKGSPKPPKSLDNNLGGKITWDEVLENPNLYEKYQQQG